MTVKQKIQATINATNATTSHTDADLTTGVKTLIAGYGSISYFSVIIVNCASPNTIVYAVGNTTYSAQSDENGTAFIGVYEAGTYDIKNASKYSYNSVHVTIQDLYTINLYDVPEEYQQIKYMTSGAANCDYDIGYVYKNKPRFVADIMIGDSRSSDAYIFGTPNAADGNYGIDIYGGGSVYARYGLVKAVSVGRTIGVNQFRNVDFSDTLKIDNATVYTFDEYDFSTNEQTVHIFRGINYYKGVSFGKVKFYDGDVLKSDLSPCIRKSDEEIGFYDKITETFKAVTGTIIAGPNI